MVNLDLCGPSVAALQHNRSKPQLSGSFNHRTAPHGGVHFGSQLKHNQKGPPSGSWLVDLQKTSKGPSGNRGEIQPRGLKMTPKLIKATHEYVLSKVGSTIDQKTKAL